MSNIVLNTKTYSGRGMLGGISTWLNTAAGVIGAFARLTLGISIPQGKGAKANVKWTLVIPVVAEEASACACPGEEVDVIDAIITVRATRGVTVATRTDMALQIKDLTASSEFQDSVISLLQSQ